MLQNCIICFDENISHDFMITLDSCDCSFCKECLIKHIEHQIDTGHFRIFCPSPTCGKKRLSNKLIRSLLKNNQILHRYEILLGNILLADNRETSRCPFCDHIYDINTLQPVLPSLIYDNSPKKNHEIELHKSPIDDHDVSSSNDSVEISLFPRPLQCPNCIDIYCAQCSVRLTKDDLIYYNYNYNYNNSKSDNTTRHQCQTLNDEILAELEIKKCPQCNHLIQRSGGCAQISCLNCSHVFCWHCLASLDSDFLLLHYDSGPCKNRLGHSRASILLNRIQAIGVCVGISALMCLASPVILISLPCVLGTRYGRFFFMKRKRVKTNRTKQKDSRSQPV